jgi:hypothetical protein
VQFHPHALGEDFTYYVHFSGAGAFVVCSIGLSLVFALREVYYVMNFDAPDAESNKSPRRRFWGRSDPGEAGEDLCVGVGREQLLEAVVVGAELFG